MHRVLSNILFKVLNLIQLNDYILILFYFSYFLNDILIYNERLKWTGVTYFTLGLYRSTTCTCNISSMSQNDDFHSRHFIFSNHNNKSSKLQSGERRKLIYTRIASLYYLIGKIFLKDV